MNNTALGAVSNKKENIRFISEAHEKFYYEKIKKKCLQMSKICMEYLRLVSICTLMVQKNGKMRKQILSEEIA